MGLPACNTHEATGVAHSRLQCGFHLTVVTFTLSSSLHVKRLIRLLLHLELGYLSWSYSSQTRKVVLIFSPTSAFGLLGSYWAKDVTRLVLRTGCGQFEVNNYLVWFPTWMFYIYEISLICAFTTCKERVWCSLSNVGFLGMCHRFESIFLQFIPCML